MRLSISTNAGTFFYTQPCTNYIKDMYPRPNKTHLILTSTYIKYLTERIMYEIYGKTKPEIKIDTQTIIEKLPVCNYLQFTIMND